MPVYRAVWQLLNAQCKMHNQGVAYGNYLNHFSKKNTTIMHYELCIMHFQIYGASAL